jgi:hypothetical protein
MKRILLVLLTVFIAAEVYAVRGTAGGPAPFLKMGAGARAVALSGAFAAYYDDTSCPYWNPASIGGMKKTSIGTMLSLMTEDRAYNYADFIFPAEFGVFSLSILNFSIGNIEGRSGDTPEYYTFSNSDYAYGLTFAKQLISAVSVGGTGKVIYRSLDKYNALGFSFDAGIHLKINEIFSAGVVFQDFLNNLTWNTNRVEHILFAMKLACLAELLDRQLKISAEGEQLESSELTARAGAELGLMKIIFLRAGCSYGFLSYSFDFTAGGGLKYGIGGVLFQADYAIVREAFFNTADLNHKFSLSAYF